MQLSESKTKQIKKPYMLSHVGGRVNKCYLGLTNQEKAMKKQTISISAAYLSPKQSGYPIQTVRFLSRYF